MRCLFAVCVVLLFGMTGMTPAAHAAPANDDFANAEQLTPAPGLPVSASGSNVGATEEEGEPNHGGAYFPTSETRNSVWYRWTNIPHGEGEVEASVCGSDYDVEFSVYVGYTVSGLTRRGSDAKPCPSGPGSRIEFRAEPGQAIWIAIDGREGEVGNYRLTLSDIGPPANPSIQGQQLKEGTGDPTTVRLQVGIRPSNSRVSVDYRTVAVPGEALPFWDYEETAGTLTFEPGENLKEIEVHIVGDRIDEGVESFQVELLSPEGVSLEFVNSPATVLIQNDDGPPPPGTTCGAFWCLEAGAGPVQMVTSGDRSELVRTIPIKRRGGSRAVMRIGEKRLPEIGPNARIQTSAEVEVSVTCLESGPRCVGSKYGYSPLVAGKIVVVRGQGRHRRARVVNRERLRCSQRRSRRNHHCVLVFAPKAVAAGRSGGCSLELVLAARHPRAGRDDKLVIGADAAHRIEGDRGRLNASVTSQNAPEPVIDAATVPSVRKVQVAGRSDRRAPRRVIYSKRLEELKKHEQVFVDARGFLRTRHLPYGTFVGAQVVLASRPDAVTSDGRARRIATLGGEITEKNGFNCTRAPSAHSNPCLVRKVGFVRMTEDARRPLYLNLVVELGARFGGPWHRTDEAAVLDRGGLRAWRYSPLGWALLSFG